MDFFNYRHSNWIFLSIKVINVKVPWYIRSQLLSFNNNDNLDAILTLNIKKDIYNRCL